MEKQFDWELGYIYVKPAYKRKGIASEIAAKLLEAFGNKNLMASTEISENPGMVKILERNGFRHYGAPWKSNRQDNFLGLFLKYK
jgi:RimJ/RimL family protein N-acetyltransferase